MNSLLPPNALDTERALDLATARIGDVPTPIRELWNADTCPADKLAWLAWAFGVDEWSDGWSNEAKRTTIRESVAVQRIKGSVASVRRVLANAGYGTAVLLEGLYQNFFDGTHTYNGFITYGETSQWATYRAVLDRPISNAQAIQVRRLMETTAPARCHLVEFVFTEAANLYDGTINFDGAYNYGTA